MNLQNISRYKILIGLFIIPFVGLFISSQSFFPYIVPKNLIFRFLAIAVFGAYAFLAYKDKTYRPSFGRIGISLSVFVGVMFVADLFGVMPLKSFFSNFERMEGFFTILLLVLLFIVASNTLKKNKIWNYLFQTFLFASVIMGFYALAESARGIDRLSAQLGNSSYLGVYMLFNLFIAVLLLVRLIENKETEKSTKWLGGLTYVAVILFDFYIFYRTGTRSALIGIMAGFVFASVLFAFFQKKSKTLKIVGLTLFGVIIISTASLYVFRNSDFVKSNGLLNRFAVLISSPADIKSYIDTEGKSRLGIWSLAIEGVKERPFLGWGQDNFNYIFNKYYKSSLYNQEAWFDRAHNVFLDWLTAGGVLGLLAYLSIFFAAFFSLWKAKERFSFEDKVILSALLIAYFIHNLFVFDSITSYILFFIVLAYIASIGEAEDRKSLPFGPVAVSVSAVACVAGLYYLVISPYISSSNLIKALINQQNPAKQLAALDNYKTSINYGIVGAPEAREQLLQVTLGILQDPNISNDVKNAYVQETDTELARQIKLTPNDTRYQLFFASYLANSGRLDEAEIYFQKAELSSPQKQTIYFEHGVMYINKKDYKKAVDILKKAYDLYPQNKEAMLYYAVALIYSGDNKTSSALVAPFKNTLTGTDNRLIRAYYDTKQSDKILDILQQKMFIAESYLRSGDRQKAIAEIQEIISINPGFKTQGEALIQQISR